MNRVLEKLSSPRRSTRDLSRNIMGTLFLAAAFAIINPNFINRYNLISIGQNLAPYAMLALGVLMPISMGGTDLSIGAVCIGSAVVAGKLYSLGMPLVLCIPVMIAFGTLMGLLNGYLIAKKHLQPFIATLGIMMFVRGSTAIFAGMPTVLYPSGCWYNYLFSTWNGIPVSFVWIFLFALVFYFIYRKTKFGRYMISIGSNEKATRISGVDVDRYILMGYGGAGFMAGVAAIFWTASFVTVSVATGNGMELDAIASVYIGGTSAAGGLANVFGSIIGSIMLVVIRSGLNYSLARLNVSVSSTYVTLVISGVIVIVAVLAEQAKGNPSKKYRVSSPQKRAKRQLVFYAVSAALLCFLVVYGVKVDKWTKERDNKTICIDMMSQGVEFWNSFEEGAYTAGEEFGYRVICRGTEGDDTSFLPKQRELVSTMLSENPAGLAIAAISDGFVDLMEEAYHKGIPVVQFDSGLGAGDLATITASDYNPLVSFVSADNYYNSEVAAEYTFPAVRDAIAASDEYVVGVIQFNEMDYAVKRATGFADRFMELAEADPETAGKCRVLIEVKPSSANNAYKDALEYLFEKGADLVYCSNLMIVNQCSDAVQAAGGKYDGVVFSGYDAGEKAYEWIKSDAKSPMIGVMDQNPYQMGYLTVKTIVDIDQGKTVDDTVTVPGKWINRESLAAEEQQAK